MKEYILNYQVFDNAKLNNEGDKGDHDIEITMTIQSNAPPKVFNLFQSIANTINQVIQGDNV